MSVQTSLNSMLFNYLPQIKGLINVARDHEVNQMVAITLRKALNTPIPVCDMNTKEISRFEDMLIAEFKYKLLIPQEI